MTKTLTRLFKVEKVNEEAGTVRILQTGIDEFTFVEATKNLFTHEGKLAQLVSEKRKLDEWIEKRGWEKDLEQMEENLVHQQGIIDVFKEATKPHFDKKIAEGVKLVSKKKKTEHYDRKTGDTKMVCRTRILNEVRAELGIDDVAHPVLYSLREKFEEVN